MSTEHNSKTFGKHKKKKRNNNHQMLIISKFALDILLNEHFLDRISMTNKSEQ
jgi:hypothetical protein